MTHQHEIEQKREIIHRIASEEVVARIEDRLNAYLTSQVVEGKLTSFDVRYGDARDFGRLMGYETREGPALFIFTLGAKESVVEGIDDILEGVYRA